ncbi:hypothetical protein MHYP_G00116480 [Metynnis hypsauchen]
MASRRVFLNSQQRPESSIRNVLKWCGEQERHKVRGCTGVALLFCMESVMDIVSGGIPENESKKEVKAACCYGNNEGQGGRMEEKACGEAQHNPGDLSPLQASRATRPRSREENNRADDMGQRQWDGAR